MSAKAGTVDNGRLAEQLRFLAASMNAEVGRHARLWSFGRSHLNAPLWALRLSGGAAAEPGQKASVLMLAQQHGDDAGNARVLIRLAEAVSGGELDDLLKHVDLIFVPRLNPDGFAAGRAANAQGIDIGRDHLLLRTTEAMSLARLIRADQPLVLVELASRRRPSILVQGDKEPFDRLLIEDANAPGAPPLTARAAREWFRDPLVESMARKH